MSDANCFGVGAEIADATAAKLRAEIERLRTALKEASEMNCGECGYCLYENECCPDCASISAVVMGALEPPSEEEGGPSHPNGQPMTKPFDSEEEE